MLRKIWEELEGMTVCMWTNIQVYMPVCVLVNVYMVKCTFAVPMGVYVVEKGKIESWTWECRKGH